MTDTERIQWLSKRLNSISSRKGYLGFEFCLLEGYQQTTGWNDAFLRELDAAIQTLPDPPVKADGG